MLTKKKCYEKLFIQSVLMWEIKSFRKNVHKKSNQQFGGEVE